MPELPEVEITKRGLQTLEGMVITELVFLRKDLRDLMPITELKAHFTNHVIRAITRKGKYLLWHISGPQNQRDVGGMICHLGMSGVFGLIKHVSNPSLPAHTHWMAHLKDLTDHSRWICYYTDPRRFGRLSLWLGPSKNSLTHPFLTSLGPDPLTLTVQQLAHHLKQRCITTKSPIKSLLLNQSCVAGLGNIYANESLFDAMISPFRPACDLTDSQYTALAYSIQTTLNCAISYGGSTLKDFKSLDGTHGLFALKCKVYNQEGQPCPRGGDPIVKVIQQQRATYWCPQCQM